MVTRWPNAGVSPIIEDAACDPSVQKTSQINTFFINKNFEAQKDEKKNIKNIPAYKTQYEVSKTKLKVKEKCTRLIFSYIMEE